MQRFQFRLQRLLKWKQQREQQAEQLVSRAYAELQTRESLVRQFRGRLAQIASDLQKQLGAQPGRWMLGYRYAVHVRQELESAEALLLRARAELEQAEARRRLIAVEVEALRHLRQQQGDAHRHNVLRHAQNKLDELVLARWVAASVNRQA